MDLGPASTASTVAYPAGLLQWDLIDTQTATLPQHGRSGVRRFHQGRESSRKDGIGTKGVMMTKKALQATRKEDRKLHRNFVRQYRGRTLDGTHPVEKRIKYWAKVAAAKLKRPDLAPDIEQEGITSLGTQSNFEGKCSLDHYILTVLVRKGVRLSNAILPGQFSYEAIDDDGGPVVKRRPWVQQSLDPDPESAFASDLLETLPNDPSSSMVNRVQEKIAEDEFMRLVAERPREQQLAVEIILKNQDAMSDRKLARELSKSLGRNVTRYEVQDILKRLRPLFEQCLWVS
jgi:hypothetical protein